MKRLWDTLIVLVICVVPESVAPATYLIKKSGTYSSEFPSDSVFVGHSSTATELTNDGYNKAFGLGGHGEPQFPEMNDSKDFHDGPLFRVTTSTRGLSNRPIFNDFHNDFQTSGHFINELDEFRMGGRLPLIEHSHEAGSMNSEEKEYVANHENGPHGEEDEEPEGEETEDEESEDQQRPQNDSEVENYAVEEKIPGDKKFKPPKVKVSPLPPPCLGFPPPTYPTPPPAPKPTKKKTKMKSYFPRYSSSMLFQQGPPYFSDPPPTRPRSNSKTKSKSAQHPRLVYQPLIIRKLTRTPIIIRHVSSPQYRRSVRHQPSPLVRNSRKTPVKEIIKELHIHHHHEPKVPGAFAAAAEIPMGHFAEPPPHTTSGYGGVRM